MILELSMFLFVELYYFLFFIFLFINFLLVLYNNNLRIQNIVVLSRFRKYMVMSDYNNKLKGKLNLTFYKIYYYLVILSVIYFYFNYPINVWICFDFLFFCDYFSTFFLMLFFIFFSFFLLILIKLNIDYFYYYEYFFILVIINFFVLFVFKINDFLFLYILIEGISLCLYILAASNYSSIKVSEAGLKYFILAVLSSLFFLFGISLIYSCFGTVNFFKIKLLLYVIDYDLLNLYKLSLGFFLIIGSFLFKIGAVPFHFWVVEVYYGVNFTTFFFFSVYSKLIFLGVLFKLILTVFSLLSSLLNLIFIVFGFGSIIFGILGSLIILDLRKLLAYGSIVHVGFLLLSLVNFNFYSVFSFIFYLIVYLFLMLSFFFFIFSLKGVKINLYNNLVDFTVLKTSSLFISFFIFFVFLSMGGVPPFLGFYTKLFVLMNLLSVNYNSIFFVLIILLINLLGIYIYLRLGVYLFFSGGNDVKIFKVLNRSFIVTFFLYMFFFLNFLGFIFIPFFYNYLYICSFYNFFFLI